MDRHDPYYRRARREGYRSRAAYKLAELDDREHFLRPAARVVDLGCAPGGWLQVALERVGPDGRVVGVDLAPFAPLGAPNAVVLRGDLRDPAIAEAVTNALGAPADVLLSDLSPKLSGIRDADIARSVALVDAACALARRVLRQGGTMVTKVFASPETDAVAARLRAGFETLKAVNPEASRRSSTEYYLVGKGFRTGRSG